MDKMYYGMAALEVSDGVIDAALMIKAMALSGGDEKLGRATYIELRAKEIESTHRKAKIASAVLTTAAVTSKITKVAANAAKNTLVSGAKVKSRGGFVGVLLKVVAFGFIVILLLVFITIMSNFM